MNNHEIRISVQGRRLETVGLHLLGRREICLEADSSLIGPAKSFLLWVADYLRTTGALLRAGETMSYGYWLVRFEDAPGDRLAVMELKADASGFVEGANLALSYLTTQSEVCARLEAEFTPPRHNQLGVISDGVLEGAVVQGVRYPSPDHMSGWWITTDLYDGKTSSLRTVHLHHVTAARPELAKFLALPYGYRFDFRDFEDVWFEPRIAQADS